MTKCPKCQQPYGSTVFLCGRCGYLKDEQGYSARQVATKRGGLSYIMTRNPNLESKDE